MRAHEFMIMPHTADPMGLIHLPGKGPNNRFDFKNKGNNKANEKHICLSQHIDLPVARLERISLRESIRIKQDLLVKSMLHLL